MQNLLMENSIRKLTTVFFFLLSFFLAALLFYSGARIFFDFEINYNEGWNAYHSQLFSYDSIQKLKPLNYPPLSFWVFHQFEKAGFDLIRVGRVISYFSFLGCFTFFILILKESVRSPLARIMGALTTLSFFLVQHPSANYVGINDPQFFSLFFLMAGFWISLSRGVSVLKFLLLFSCFIVGLSIKHNALALPSTVLISGVLLTKNQRLKISISSILLIFLLCLFWRSFSPEYFAENFFLPRQVALGELFWKFTNFFSGFLPFVIISVFYALLKFGKRSTFLENQIFILFGASLAIGFLFSLGVGVSINSFFEFFFAMGVVIGLFWEGLEKKLDRNPEFSVVLPCVFFILFSEVGTRAYRFEILNLRRSFVTLFEREKIFQERLAFLSQKSGAKICESLYLCFRLKEPFRIDPFLSRLLTEKQVVSEAKALEVFRENRIEWVELNSGIENETPGMTRFSRSIRNEISTRFERDREDFDSVIYKKVNK